MLILNVFYLYITSFTKMYNRLGNYFYSFFIFAPSHTRLYHHVLRATDKAVGYEKRYHNSQDDANNLDRCTLRLFASL